MSERLDSFSLIVVLSFPLGCVADNFRENEDASQY